MAASDVLAVFVVGTRAQLIKVAPVIVACERNSQSVLLLMTGQHKETMQDLVEEFGIRAPQESAVRVSERSTVMSLLRWIPLAYIGISRKLRKLKAAHITANVVVHGDTMSTVLGALAARRYGMRVFHLESGLTSGRLLDPFPEELSRRIVFRLTDVAVCPGAGPTALMSRKYQCEAVDSVENTIVDAVMMATQESTAGESLPDVHSQPYFVASLHRFQNIFDATRLRFLLDLLTQVAARYPVYFVLHPATRKRLESEGLLDRLSSTEGIRLSPRLGYRQFLALAAGAACVLTDGGSNQEELAVLGVPTIVMRQHTERMDGLGENAVMEGSVEAGLVDYCLSGRFLALRRPSRIKVGMGPSLLVADLLSRGEV